MKYCSSCGRAGMEGMKFCPQCGQRLMGSNSEEEQRYIDKPEAPPKEMNWFERHLNWTMVLAWVGANVIAIFIMALMALDPLMSEDALYGIAFIITLAVSIPVGWWVLRKKNRSLAWLLICWTIFFLLISNKSRTEEQSK